MSKLILGTKRTLKHTFNLYFQKDETRIVGEKGNLQRIKKSFKKLKLRQPT